MPVTNRTTEDLLDFVDTSAIGLHWVASDGSILWANPSDYTMLGYSEDEYVGHNIAEFHTDPDVIADILRRLGAGERLDDFEASLRCKDGSSRQVLITSSVKFDDDGKFCHTRCFTIDVTGRKADGVRIEALLREIERLTFVNSKGGLVDSILNASPHGIIVSDAQGKLVLHNKAAETIWAGSASAETVEGWGKYRAFHRDGRPYAPEDWAMARCLNHGETVQPEETHFQRFDGRHGVLLGGAAPIFRADGRLDGAVAVFADITRFKEADAALRLSYERYATTLQSIGDAVISTDADGRIKLMNSVAERLTKWTLADATDRPLVEVFRIVNEQTREAVESPVDKVLREGKIVGLANHTVLIARDESELAIDDSGAPIFDDKRQLAGVVLVFRDVTEKRQEEHRRRFINEASAILASSLDYQSTLTSVAKLAVPTIADWCAVDIVEGNRVSRLAIAHVDNQKVQLAAALEARYPTDAQSPHGVHEVIRSGKTQVVSRIPDELLVASAVDAEHLRLIRELGLYSSMTIPLRARGRILGAITFVAAESKREFGTRDIALAEELSNLAALAVNNAGLYREAQEANHAKDDFLATVSHELRTPLAAILVWASLLRTSEMPEDKRARGLETIERNAQVQSQLIEDILDVSRIISGQLRLDVRAVDLVTVIETAAETLRFAAETKGVRVLLDLDRVEASVSGDPSRLQQIVWNLVSNALKFTKQGGTVKVGLARIDSKVEIEVTDSGIGIDPEFLPHVFERFRQADSKSTRQAGGLGLGLSIVRELVALHGGSVEAFSAGQGRGSTFRVTLPLAVSTVGRQRISEASAPLAPPSLDGVRVLLVDDEADARILLTEILERRGAIVQTVGSAAEALAVIAAAPPDVLVSDIGMPGEDGYSLIRKVRSLASGSSKMLPAVALTAFARVEDRSRALMAGFQSHIVKPVDATELVIVVAALAGRMS